MTIHPRKTAMRHIYPSLFACIFLGSQALAQDNVKTPEAKKTSVDDNTIRTLIAQLGDSAFAVREAAHKRLADLGEPALEMLQKAAKENVDPEVREHLRQLVQAITSSFFTEVRAFERPQGYTQRLAVTPDGRKVVAIGFGSLRCLNLADGKETVAFEWPATLRFSWAFGMAPDGLRVIVGSDDHMARVFDVKTGKLINELKGHTGALYGAALMPGGKRAVTGGMDRSLRLWDVDSGKELRAFDNVPDNVQYVAVSPDGKLLAVGHTIGYEVPGTIRIWDIESGKEVRALTGHTQRLCSVRFSKDGKTLLSSSFDKTVRLWDVAQGKLLKTFQGHPGRVESAAFTVDEKRVISVGDENNPIVIMWDVASGAILYQTTPLGAGLLDVAVLPDGRHCLTCGKDGTIRLWAWKR
jgi:WD40 repeat protein